MFVRDIAMTAAILGFFAAAWFGWAQQRPPPAWKVGLTVGSLAGMAVAITGGTLAWQNWDAGSVLADDRSLRAYLIIVGIEFAVAAVGAVALLVARKTEYQAPWICMVVAVHFYPMAPVLHDARLYLLATVLTIAALTAIPLARRRNLAISATTGAAAGTALLAVATWSIATLII